MDREERAHKDNENVEHPEGASEGSGLFERTRDVLGNLTGPSARESTGKERNASRVVRGTKSQSDSIEEPGPNGDALRRKSEVHSDQAVKANRTVEELVREENEMLSATAGEVERELNEYLAHSKREVDDELVWDYNPGRSLETDEAEVDNLTSYLSERSSELDETFEKIANVDQSIDSLRDDLEYVEETLDEKKDEKDSEGERVLLEKQDRMTPSEAREAEIDDLLGFAEDVSHSTEETIQQDIDELEDRRDELHSRVDSLEDVESALYDARDEIIDEIETVYEPHAEEMESLSQELATMLREDVKYLEDLASMEMPNLTEEHGTRFVDDAASDLQKTRDESAYGLVERIDRLAYSLDNIQQEHGDLVDLLPDQYVEDGEFTRVETSTEMIADLEEELAGGYGSFEERVTDAYEEATGEDLYEAFDNADSTLAHLRASYSDEVAE